jgi:[acyl-carrier-protein] S-malonyltransferase
MARRAALLFPGQASQQVGMGRLAYARFPAARAVFDRVDAVLGMPIGETCFSGPAERLLETAWQQPAVFACGVAFFAAWWESARDTHEIVGAAGHSLGEYGALVAAGALELEVAATLVALRGSLMQAASNAVPGGMIAILGLDVATVADLCRDASRPEAGPAEIVVLANDNAPGQHVLSGGLAAIERAGAAARSMGAKRVIPLKVAGAFHSPLMSGAVDTLAEAIERAPFARCVFPVIANSTREPLSEPADVRSELIRQVTSPVRWVESMHALAGFSPELWVDAGPGNVVSGLASRAIPGIETANLAALVDVEDPA